MDTCVCCGAYAAEGSQLCPACQKQLPFSPAYAAADFLFSADNTNILVEIDGSFWSHSPAC